MQVFGQIDAAGFHRRILFFKRDDLLLHGVAAIVDDDVELTILVAQCSMQVSIRLVTDDNLDAGLGHLRADRIDVHANDLCLRAKVMLPHLQRATLVDAEFKQADGAVAISIEVALVNGKVVVPLINKAPGIIVEVLEQIAMQ